MGISKSKNIYLDTYTTMIKYNFDRTVIHNLFQIQISCSLSLVEDPIRNRILYYMTTFMTFGFL